VTGKPDVSPQAPHERPERSGWQTILAIGGALTQVMAVVLHSSKALESECDTRAPPPRSFLVALSLHVDDDGVLGGSRVCGVSAVSPGTLTLLPTTRKQYQRILSGLPHL
jgi:hypothetical protein